MKETLRNLLPRRRTGVLSVLLATTLAASVVMLAGCKKESADDAQGAKTAGAPVPAASVAPEVQAQIDASQKADAARHAALTGQANGGAATAGAPR